jgi:hypothetical protein
MHHVSLNGMEAGASVRREFRACHAKFFFFPIRQVLTACLKEAQLPAAVTSNTDSTGVVPAGAAYRMDENLTVYSDVTGGCERILRTPVPLSYTR